MRKSDYNDIRWIEDHLYNRSYGKDCPTDIRNAGIKQAKFGAKSNDAEFTLLLPSMKILTIEDVKGKHSVHHAYQTN